MKIGDKFENLTILDIEQRNSRKYCLCKCGNCSNEKWIRADSLKRIKACGCMKINTQFKPNDLTNRKFGRLTAIKSTNKKAKSGHYIWICKCDCGNEIEVIESSLTTGKTRSCGCLQKEVMRENIKLATKANKEKNIIDNTNLALLKKTEAYSNSKTKVRGVSWDKEKRKYCAQIEFKKRHYNLGYFDNIKEAEEAYKKAKEKFLKEINKRSIL
ncbi:TPA: AP2 domain-containing protein [Clostridioides difficile]